MPWQVRRTFTEVLVVQGDMVSPWIRSTLPDLVINLILTVWNKEKEREKRGEGRRDREKGIMGSPLGQRTVT